MTTLNLGNAMLRGLLVGGAIGIIYGLFKVLFRRSGEIILLPEMKQCSFGEMMKLSLQSPVLLVTGSVERGSGEEMAKETFQKEVLPKIQELANNRRTHLFWTNMQGLGVSSALLEFLSKGGVKFSGAFLISNKKILKHARFGLLSSDVNEVDAILGLLSSWPKMYCTKCGYELADNPRFCRHCGHRIALLGRKFSHVFPGRL